MSSKKTSMSREMKKTKKNLVKGYVLAYITGKFCYKYAAINRM